MMDQQTALVQYVTSLFAPEDAALQSIQVEAEKNNMPTISLDPHEAQLLQFLARAVGARKIVEIGTLAGYSGTWLARALPDDGTLFTLEASPKHAEVARRNFARAGLSDKIELIEGPAQESLRRLATKAPFDFVFIDADKESYPLYLDWAVENLRPGGMVAAHNAFRSGAVLKPQSEGDRVMDEFNRSLAAHPQLHSTLMAVGDGMAVGIKK